MRCPFRTLRKSTGPSVSAHPPPRRHRHRDHGVLAPNRPLRAAVTALAHDRADRGEPRGSGLPPPQDLEQVSMPAQQRLGTNHMPCVPPARVHRAKRSSNRQSARCSRGRSMRRRSTMTSRRSKAFSAMSSERVRVRSPAAAAISLAPERTGRSRRLRARVRMTNTAVAEFKFRRPCEWPTTTKLEGNRSGRDSSRPWRPLPEGSRPAAIYPGNPLISPADAKRSLYGSGVVPLNFLSFFFLEGAFAGLSCYVSLQRNEGRLAAGRSGFGDSDPRLRQCIGELSLVAIEYGRYRGPAPLRAFLPSR
jgi:hypothetical protein